MTGGMATSRVVWGGVTMFDHASHMAQCGGLFIASLLAEKGTDGSQMVRSGAPSIQRGVGESYPYEL